MRSFNMLQSIESIISTNIDSFIQELHEKFGVPVDEMELIWKTVSSEKKKMTTLSSSTSKKNKKTTEKKKKNKKKLSSWLQFSHDQRALLKKDHPNLTFGEISKKISEAWKLLSMEEKKSYTSKLLAEMEDEDAGDEGDTDIENDDPYVTTNEAVVEDKDDEEVKEDSFSMTIYTADQLSVMKTKELKEICDNLHLSKTGKKQELVDRITNCQKSLTSTTKKSTDSDDDDDEYDSHTSDDEDFH